MLRRFMQSGGTANSTQDIVNQASSGDQQAESFMQKYGHWLAKSLASMINILDHDAIVLGGGLSNIERLYRNVLEQWQNYVFSDQVTTRLLKAKPGDSSGVRGAAWLWPAVNENKPYKVICVSKKEKTITEESLKEEIRLFRQQQKTLILASQSPDNQPLASYAPFIEDDDGAFFLLLSGLASHSINLQDHQSEHSTLSVLLIEDEQTARNLFARKRLNYSCTVNIWSREHPQWQEKINTLQNKFGKTIEVLAGLGDFNLYCLRPLQGHYVRGFGQAYELENAVIPVFINK